MRYIIITLIVLITGSCTTPSIIATREQQKGDAHFNMHRYNEAIEHYINYLDASAKLGIYRNPGMEADVCRKIAHAYSFRGSYSAAEDYLQRAIAADSLDNNQMGLVLSYSDMGKVSLAAGRFAEGINYLEHALLLGAENEESFKNIRRESAANIYLGLAQAYLSMGRFDDALNTTEKAHLLFTRTGYEEGLIETFLLFGIIYSDIGFVNKADEMIDRSVVLSEQAGLSTVRQHLMKAELAGMKGRFSDALAANENALAEASRVKIIPQIIWANIRSGDLYIMLGDTKNAELFYREAGRLSDENREALFLNAALNLRKNELDGIEEYFQTGGLSTAGGLLYLKMADIEIEKEEYTAALNYLQMADSSFKEGPNNEGMARSGLGMVRVYTGRNLAESAVVKANQVLAMSNNNETLWQSWFYKGQAMEMLNQSDSAEYAYREAIGIIEESRGNITTEKLRGLYINDKIKVYDRLINLLIEKDNLRESLLMSERARARAFLDMLGGKMPGPGFSPAKELTGQEQELSTRLTHLQKQLYNVYFAEHDLTRTLEIERSLTAELTETQDEYQLLLSRLRAANPEYYNMITMDPPLLRDIQSAIPSSAAVMQYWISEEKIYLWIIRHNKLDMVIIETPPAEFYEKVRQAGKHLKNNNVEAGTPLLKELYYDLISPAEQYIDDVATLCIIPHGILHILPFHALINKENRYLMEDYYLAYMPSSSVMTEMSKEKCTQRDSFLGMALGDNMIGLFSGLPGTTWELKNISSQFPDPVLAFETVSTESFLRNNVSGKDILHLATHGVFNEARPRYSFLLFSPDETDDGQLTVNEIFGLDLEACIVTLSACETGVSDISKGDELTGLSRAFLGAGANTVSVSLWSVADRPTAELMISYYKHLVNTPPHVAMTRAQREILEKYPGPFYWAPFVVIGGSAGIQL